jgi:hypothetical protein
MQAAGELVSRVFRDPGVIHRFSVSDWDKMVCQTRQAGLLARLHVLLEQEGLDAAIPAVARWHFEVATVLAANQRSAIRRELRHVSELLAGLDFPLVALKGAAYLAAGLPAARGRALDEIDLLVPSERVDKVETTLKLADWHAANLPDYDQRYYRRWRHEAPLLQHLRCTTVINVHHAILPNTARFHPDAARLRQRAVELPDFPGMAVLAAEDRILHAATLLFHDDTLPHGLRDLSDLDLLLRQAATEADFWPQLLARTTEMDLSLPLFYALRYVQHFFDTPVPDAVSDHLAAAAPRRPTLKLMDGIYTRMLAPDHHSCQDSLVALARHATYLRAHWQRRPPRLLLPHLFHKAFISRYQHAPNPA